MGENSAMARPRITDETINRAVTALLKWLHSKTNHKSQSGDLFIYLILTLKKIPHRGRSLSFPLPLPHPIHRRVSLVFDDRPASPHSLSSLQTAVDSLPLPITDLVPLSEARSCRQLAAGLSLVDRRIAKLLPKNKKDKDGGVMRELNMLQKSWPEEARRSLCSTVMSFRGGTCVGIRVGRAGQARVEIVENVAAAVEGAVANVPKKWGNVRGFHVKAAESVALPIYEMEEDEGREKRKGEAEEEVLEGGREAKRSKAAV